MSRRRCFPYMVTQTVFRAFTIDYVPESRSRSARPAKSPNCLQLQCKVYPIAR